MKWILALAALAVAQRPASHAPGSVANATTIPLDAGRAAPRLRGRLPTPSRALSIAPAATIRSNATTIPSMPPTTSVVPLLLPTTEPMATAPVESAPTTTDPPEIQVADEAGDFPWKILSQQLEASMLT
ncbi:hypothetical protein H310_03645 [Aphanomyces invadans]|uniref:RxLR effector protein n=1 Tax=Aphanomyces invadans TaxID=157072 RepID=A0A024UJL2_9STRA|nr:hypothetical protein H310_03645 [Aphanomyces invadans]ETW06047.1 hypothetical protein H310_03645 [Aphanomyces invadans]|eukprot:XP_008865824.1 hypothetical protein H310_03645 [Aphanomyces invadans]